MAKRKKALVDQYNASSLWKSTEKRRGKDDQGDERNAPADTSQIAAADPRLGAGIDFS